LGLKSEAQPTPKNHEQSTLRVGWAALQPNNPLSIHADVKKCTILKAWVTVKNNNNPQKNILFQ
jgi:hypothetical protein